MPLVTTMFLKIVRRYSTGEPVTFDWLAHQLGFPFGPPKTILDLVHLEATHDVLDVYLWLSYRFQVFMTLPTYVNFVSLFIFNFIGLLP